MFLAFWSFVAATSTQEWARQGDPPVSEVPVANNVFGEMVGRRCTCLAHLRDILFDFFHTTGVFVFNLTRNE